MENTEAREKQRLKDIIRNDAKETQFELGRKTREILSRPINLLLVAFGALLLFVIDYAAEKTMDTLLDNEPPQIAMLDNELRATNDELRKSASEIRTLISSIDSQSITDTQLRQQFDDLQSRLSGLTEIVERASAQTDKVAAISEALRQQWERNRRVADGRIDGVPDLVLAAGEAVSVCSGLATIGVIRVTAEDGTATLKTNDWTYWVNPGQRVPLMGGGTLGFIGLKDGNVQMKVQCAG
jgi:methyl-accepting chemotaxis protein